ncbi:uncharacterized protein LOC127287826 [Leptopilina boulardi]|uniref:uncharacterized protein LOC127287826 n=1 Tax=Leptopilina boulardi TaxID=63433 RepID=UPI0021F52971|nr:uncharacterized protein LOC127287826 [Leptopilina boulardi]
MCEIVGSGASDHRKRLLALLEKVKNMKPATDPEEVERAPDEEEKGRISKIAACIRVYNLLGKIGGERGFLVEFGDWGRAPVRQDDQALWRLDPAMRGSGPKKQYSRSQWHQEYRWCESTRGYVCRGFWATVSRLSLHTISSPLNFYFICFSFLSFFFLV